MSADHPERALVHQLLAASPCDVAVTTNPLAIALGMRLEECAPDRIRARFNVGESFTQGNGVVQGGILAAMLDFGMIFAAFTRLAPGHTLASVSQTTNYLRPAQAGSFRVAAELDRAGRRLIHAHATLCGPDGRPVATASAPIAVIPQD